MTRRCIIMTLLNQLLGYAWFGTMVLWVAVMLCPENVRKWLFSGVYPQCRVGVLCAVGLMVLVTANEFHTMNIYTKRLLQPMSHAEKLDAQRFKFHAERNFYMDTSMCILLASLDRLYSLYRNKNKPEQ